MNFRRCIRWMAKKIKSLLFAAIAITLVTAFGYYIGVSGDDSAEDCKMDILKFSFVFAIMWCLSSWWSWRIGQKLDDKTYDWQIKLCGLIYGPLILIPTIMEYLKRKHRAKYTPNEQRNKKDIYTFWDWLFGHE